MKKNLTLIHKNNVQIISLTQAGWLLVPVVMSKFNTKFFYCKKYILKLVKRLFITLKDYKFKT